MADDLLPIVRRPRWPDAEPEKKSTAGGWVGTFGGSGLVWQQLRAAVAFVFCATSGAAAQQVVEFGPFFVDLSYPRFIVLDGEIVEGAAEQFASAFDRFPDAEALLLNSPGGSMAEAVQIASLVFESRLSTIIPDFAGCYSACAYVFLAGDGRVVDGELGVHQFVSDRPDTSDAQVMSAVIAAMLDDFDVSPAVRFLALTTPPEGMHVFNRAEIAEYGIERAPGGSRMPFVAGGDGFGLAVYVGLDFYGADIAQFRSSNPADCAAICLSNSRCQAFTFNVATRAGPNCFIKTSIGIPDGNVDAFSGLIVPLNEAAPSYVVAAIDPNFSLIEGYDFPGGDLSASPHLAANTRDACRLACVQNPMCAGFSFVHRLEDCWLKGFLGGGIARDGITSGVKRAPQYYTAVEVIPLN